MRRPDGGRLIGIRHLVHDEPDPDWLLRDDVRRGHAALGRRGLAYDLLLRVCEIPAALRTVADFPELRFIVDHIAKPDIAANAVSPWSALDAFGPSRCMFGSNWPVCLMAGECRRNKAALEFCLTDLSASERAAVMGGSAIEAYRLRIPSR